MAAPQDVTELFIDTLAYVDVRAKMFESGLQA